MEYDRDDLFKGTCLHESAHLVIAHALGGDASHVIATIPGYTVDNVSGWASASCENPKDDVVVLLAGTIGATFGMGFDYSAKDPRPVKGIRRKPVSCSGNMEFTKSDEPPAVYTDEQSFIEAIQSGGREDRRRAWRACRKLCRTEEEAFELYLGLEERAVVLVAENLERIKMLADVLGRKLVMSQTAITALLG